MPRFVWFAAVIAATVLCGVVNAQSLHAEIDRLIAAGSPDYAKKAALIADDAEFLRRVQIDLAGTIPSGADARSFFADTSTDKRTKLIDRLLASPDRARHLATVFDDLLLDRRPDKHVPAAEWRKFLTDSFAANKPYDVLIREVLSADGADAKTRPAAKFVLDRDAEPHQLTRDVSRLFLGMNLTCCQCHDHPQIRSYQQDHYFGLYSFLSRTQLAADIKPSALGEKADGEVTFTSVFDTAKAVKPASLRLPGGAIIVEPKLEKGKEYKVAPAKGVRPVPSFSRRAQLAPALTASRQFARTAANRLWALMFGRGIIQPVEFDHKANAPSHPELLNKLTDELIAHKFDVRWFLREIALSQTYQRSSKQTAVETPPDRFLAASVRPLSAAQLARSLMQATGILAGERNDNAVRTFVVTFGGKPGEPAAEFQATIDQTLFVANGSLLRQWLAPRSGTLTERLAKLKTNAEVADELFSSVLTRQPSTDEVKAVGEYLKDRTTDRPAALQELAWALLASAEFRFNH